MNDERQTVARRYAQAVLNYCAPTYDTVTHVWHIGSYFYQHSVSAFFLRISSISSDDKIGIILRVVREQGVSSDAAIDLMTRILHLLKRDGRLSLFMHVCILLYKEYQYRHNIQSCAVVVSHDVDMSTIQPVISWLEQRVHRTLEPYYQVDDRIIAGIRVRGETFYWEDSVARDIREMKHEAHAEWGIS